MYGELDTCDRVAPTIDGIGYRDVKCGLTGRGQTVDVTGGLDGCVTGHYSQIRLDRPR